MPRCPNGSRKNKQGVCECKVGWIKYKQSCVPKLTPNVTTVKILKRCPNGSRKNKNRICECKDKTKELYRNTCVDKESPKESPKELSQKSFQDSLEEPIEEPIQEPVNKPSTVKANLLIKPSLNPSKRLLHELFVGCCDMTETLKNKKNSLTMQYTKNEEQAKKCMLTKNMKECTTPCRVSSNGKNCLPDYTQEELEALENTLNLNNDIQTLDDPFIFNSKYDGKLIKLIKIIPFKIIQNINKVSNNNFDKFLETYYVCVYEYNNIRCICFSSGIVISPSLLLFRKDKQYLRFDSLVNELFDIDTDYLICGHSMGSAFSQYLCSLNWGNFENYKNKSYLISSAGFKCLTEEQKILVEEKFINRIWCYCYAAKLMSYKDPYVMDPFVMNSPMALPNYFTFDLYILKQYFDSITFEQKTVLDLDTIIDPNQIPKNNIFTILEEKFNYSSTVLAQLCHSWTESYRKAFIDLLDANLFGNSNSKNSKNRKIIKKSKKRMNENTAARKIQHTVVKHVFKQLKNICPNVSDCLLIGKYRPYILKIFEQFNLRLANNKIKRIGIESRNGFIFELEFIKDHFKSYSILKSNMERNNDNLWYEFTIGKYLNQFTKILPIFIETYNLYKYNTTDIKTLLLEKSNINKVIDVKTITGKNIYELFREHNNMTLKDACTQPENIVFTSQNIQHSNTLFDLILNKNISNYDLASSLFQIYFSLCTLNNYLSSFAHYDLHTGNVLLYKPFGNNIIHYRYHFTDTGEVREIYTSYMVKLIDYGRSYTDISTDLFRQINEPEYRDTKVCGSDYGSNRGFFISKYERKAMFIDYENVNLSHDLRLLQNIKEMNRYESNDIVPIFNKVQYNVGIDKYSQYYRFGTKPNEQRGYLNSINNIFDVPDNLWEYISGHQIKPSEDKIKAVIDIYDDAKTQLNIKLI